MLFRSERIEPKVLRTFGRMASPRATDVRIEYEGADVRQAPSRCRPIFDGDAVEVYARCEGRRPRRVRLSCTLPNGPRSWELPLMPAPEGGAVAIMWAREMIQELESSEPRRSDDKRLAAISKQFGVLCRSTMFVAVEHRSIEERTQGMPEQRRVPVALAAGWGGIRSTLVLYAQAARAYSCGSPGIAKMPRPCMVEYSLRGVRRRTISRARALSEQDAAFFECQEVLATQQADGRLGCKALKRRHNRDHAQALRAALEATLKASGLPERMIREAGPAWTAVGLLTLRTRWPDQRAMWRAAWDKAVDYLATEAGAPREAILRWLDAAEAALTAA